MAWLLIRAFSDEKATAWKLGDVVEVRPDDFTEWGRLETLPRFVRIRVTGVTVGACKHLLEQLDEDDEVVALRGRFGILQQVTRKRLNRIRRWSVRLSDLPAGARNTLLNTGELTVTRVQAISYIKNRLGENVVLD